MAIDLQSIKTVGVIFPQAIKDDADFVGGKDSTPVSVDTLNFDYAAFKVMFGSIDATAANFTIYESDDDSNYSAVSGLDFTSDATAPGASDDNEIWTAFIDLRKRKRYLQIDLTAGNGASGTFAVAWCDLSRGATHPTDATGRGHATELIV